jgi:uncharacterized protein YvpB
MKIKNGISSNEYGIVEKIMDRTLTEANKGSVTAKQDYINLVTKAIVTTPSYSADEDPTTQDAERVLKFNDEMAKATSPDAKFNVARKYGINLNNMSGSQLDEVYESANKLMDPTVVANKGLRNHLTSLWDKTKDERYNIKAKNKFLEKLDEINAKLSQDVIEAVRTKKDEYGDKWVHAFESYIDKNGKQVDKKTFVANMVTKGYSPSEASEMYRHDIDGETDKDEAGLVSMWARAYTEFARPEGELTWLGITGSGNSEARGQQWLVDPASEQSIGTRGAMSVFRDVLSNPNAIFSSGYFSETLPQSDEKAKLIMRTLFEDIIKNPKGKDRPLFDLTYIDIATGDETKAAVNIKIPISYSNKYRKSGKEDGIMSESERLAIEGITVYFDKASAKNIFTQGASMTAPEILMNWDNEIPIDTYPKYTKDVTIKANPTTGMYNVRGQYRRRLRSDGSEEFDSIESDIPMIVNIKDALAQTELYLSQVDEKNKALDNQYKQDNRK